MQRNHNHELFALPQWQVSGLNALFAAHTIRKFAMSLIELFGPLYIFHLFKEQYNFLGNNQFLVLVLIYYALQKISILLLSYPVTTVITRLGFRYSMLIGNSILVIKLLFLIFAQKEIELLIPSALLAGLYIPFYWLPYHSIFVTDGKISKFGQEISTMAMLGQFCTISAPFIGGVIIMQLDFTILYALVLMLVLIAALPLFFMPHHTHAPLPTLEKIWHGFWQKGFKKSRISFTAAGIEGQINGVLWPFFLFLLVKNYEIMGGLTSAALMASFIFLFIVGRLVDKKNRTKIFQFGAVGNGLVWITKIFVKTIPQIFIADTFHQVVSIFHSVSYGAIFYTKADHKGTMQYLLWRECALYSGCLGILLLSIILILLGVNWVYIFALAAIASFLTTTITT